MRTRSKIAGALLAAGLAAAGSAQAALLWGVDASTDNLVTIDTGSGTVNVIGNLPGTGTFGGLDFDAGGQLYVLKAGQGLFRVNAGDATGVLVGTQPGRTLESFEIIGNRGYAADVFNESLYEIDLGTGAATLIGSHSQSGNDERVTGLAHGAGALFGTRIFQNDLVRLNVGTGDIDAVVGVHGLGSLTSLAYADGSLWGIPAFTSDLYSINPATGAATLVNGALANVSHITGLTAREDAQVPEPGTLLLVSVLLAGYGLRSRSRRKTAG